MQAWDTRIDAAGGAHRSDLEDWVGCVATFASGATGVLESSKLATGRGEGGESRDYCEVNGPDGTLVYELQHPHQLLGASGGGRLAQMQVPEDLIAFDPPLPAGVDPLTAFRWWQNAEFIAAIREGRPAVPSFHDGVRAQAVIDAIVRSAAERREVDV
jgi:predicted dehydrogenase